MVSLLQNWNVIFTLELYMAYMMTLIGGIACPTKNGSKSWGSIPSSPPGEFTMTQEATIESLRINSGHL